MNKEGELKHPVTMTFVERRIFIIRGQRVMIDGDLAGLYRVRTKELNKAVKRNRRRFPSDFMFQLTTKEQEALRFQIGTSKKRRGGRRYLPFAFTEQGVAMLSTVLRGERAIQVNIAVMRAFVKLRQVISTNKELADWLNDHEKRLEVHDGEIRSIFGAIRELMSPPEKAKKNIGFREKSAVPYGKRAFKEAALS